MSVAGVLVQGGAKAGLSSGPGVLAPARPAADVRPALPGVTPQELDAAFAACREVVRTRARNFYYGLRLTPEPRRSAVYAIYAWMRSADDDADAEGSPEQRRAALSRARRLTQSLFAEPAEIVARVRGGELAPFWLAFGATAHSYSLEPSLFAEMLDGLEEDLDHAGYPTDAELFRYCYRVASTVGLVCVWIWGVRPGVDPAVVRDLAIRRGQAFQRTNILRDFAQDFDQSPRRVYLPLDALAAEGLTPESLRSWADPAACARVVASQAALARRYYDESSPLDAMIDPACLPTLWAMTRIYSGLLGVIERGPARVVGPSRIRLASHRKAAIALAASVRARTGRWG